MSRSMKNRAIPTAFNAPTLEEAKAMLESGAERLELFDLEVVPVNQFPHFA